MANFEEPTGEMVADWSAWVADRPQVVRDLILSRDFAPWKLYRLKTSGHRVTIHSFDEHKDGPPTLRVHVTGKYNAVAFERTVFGIHPEDLIECELPASGEQLGSANLSEDQVRALFEQIGRT